jgi:hypothetical protein
MGSTVNQITDANSLRLILTIGSAMGIIQILVLINVLTRTLIKQLHAYSEIVLVRRAKEVGARIATLARSLVEPIGMQVKFQQLVKINVLDQMLTIPHHAILRNVRIRWVFGAKIAILVSSLMVQIGIKRRYLQRA